MDDFENKLGQILGNPEMMGKIMAMAQSLNTATPQSSPSPEKPAQTAMPDMDMGMLQKLAGLAGQSRVDTHQQALLRALHPYLSRQRISKLERAMRAAKMAGIATAFLGNAHTGR